MNGTAENVSVEPSQSVPIPPPSGKPRNYKLPPPGSGGRKNWFEVPEISEKYMAYQLLRSQGIAQEKAAEMIGYSAAYSWTIERKIKEQRGETGELSPFLTEKRIKRAGTVVDKIMQGQTFGTIKEIKDSTALRAAETVLDRSHPKRSESDSGPSLSFVTINLGMMAQGGAGPPMLDVTPILENGPSNPQSAIFDGDGI